MTTLMVFSNEQRVKAILTVILTERIVKQSNHALFFPSTFLMNFKSLPLLILQSLTFFLKSKGPSNEMFAVDEIAKLNVSIFLFLSK